MEKQALIFFGGVKIDTYFGRTIWQLICTYKKLKFMHLYEASLLGISLTGIFKTRHRNAYKNIHCRIIYNSKTLKKSQMFIFGGLVK